MASVVGNLFYRWRHFFDDVAYQNQIRSINHLALPSKVFLTLFFVQIIASCAAQSRLDSVLSRLNPQSWSASIEKKAAKLQEKIISKNQKTLSRLQKQEEKIYRKMLRGKDSLQAKAALADITTKYQSLKNKLNNPSIPGQAKTYISKLDTLSTALKFLDQQGAGGKLKNALVQTQSLQDKFQQAEEIKKFIRERKQQLKQQLEQLERF